MLVETISRLCKVCTEVRVVAEFYPRKTICWSCYRKRKLVIEAGERKRRGVRTRQHILEYLKRYRDTNKEVLRQKVLARFRANPELRQIVSKKTSEWAKQNPEKASGYWHVRRAKKAKCPGSHSAAQWQTLVDYYGHRCLRCGKHEDEVGRLTRDHIVPLGPDCTNNIDNLQPLCKSCNSVKKDRQAIDYRSEFFYIIDMSPTPSHLANEAPNAALAFRAA